MNCHVSEECKSICSAKSAFYQLKSELFFNNIFPRGIVRFTVFHPRVDHMWRVGKKVGLRQSCRKDFRKDGNSNDCRFEP
jgi:hypothetical protein